MCWEVWQHQWRCRTQKRSCFKKKRNQPILKLSSSWTEHMAKCTNYFLIYSWTAPNCSNSTVTRLKILGETPLTDCWYSTLEFPWKPLVLLPIAWITRTEVLNLLWQPSFINLSQPFKIRHIIPSPSLTGKAVVKYSRHFQQAGKLYIRVTYRDILNSSFQNNNYETKSFIILNILSRAQLKLNINRKSSCDREEPQEIFSEQCTTDLIYKEKAFLTYTLKQEKKWRVVIVFLGGFLKFI